MWGPREHGEWVGLMDPREQEMACLSGGCKGPPPPWGLGKATFFWPGSQQVTHTPRKDHCGRWGLWAWKRKDIPACSQGLLWRGEGRIRDF